MRKNPETTEFLQGRYKCKGLFSLFRPVQAIGAGQGRQGAGAILQQRGGGGQSVSGKSVCHGGNHFQCQGTCRFIPGFILIVTALRFKYLLLTRRRDNI